MLPGLFAGDNEPLHNGPELPALLPVGPPDARPALYTAFFVLACLTGSGVILYLLVHAWLIHRVWRTRALRFRHFTVISAAAVILFIGAASFGAFTGESGAQGGSIIGGLFLCNIYVYILAYLYSCGPATLQELDQHGRQREERRVLDLEYKQLGPASTIDLDMMQPGPRKQDAPKANGPSLKSKLKLRGNKLEGDGQESPASKELKDDGQFTNPDLNEKDDEDEKSGSFEL